MPATAGGSACRDDLELALLDAALGRDLPVLAVCRGMQILNVHLGGSWSSSSPTSWDPNDHQPRPGSVRTDRRDRPSPRARFVGCSANGPMCCAATIRPSARWGAVWW